MNHIRRSLGAITADQLAQANQQVAELSQRLARQIGIIRQAETAGFDRGLVSELRATHARLFAQLQALTDTIPSLSTSALEEWIVRATGLEASVAAFEAHTRAQLPSAQRRQTGIVAASTIGALAVAGLIAAGLWYAKEARR